MSELNCIICKHDESLHAVNLCNVKFCALCFHFWLTDNPQKRSGLVKHEFCPDNLQFIEDLAKEKNLV
jgi:hypothetical protein